LSSIKKGIDPIALDMFQKANIVAIRRAKRRNMERLPRACGGYAVNSVDNLTPDCLGWANVVYEHVLGDEKFTFIEGCKNPTACTILVKGPHDHVIRQLQDAIRDGLRAVANTLEDKSLVSGGGAFESAAACMLRTMQVTLEEKAGVLSFANALEIIPRTLAQNSGFDPYTIIEDLRTKAGGSKHLGVDVETGKAVEIDKSFIFDNYRVKKQFLHLGTLIAVKLLLVDEILSAGKKMGGAKPQE